MPDTNATIWIVGAVSGILSGIFTYLASRKNSETVSTPDLINAITHRSIEQEKRIDKLEEKQQQLENDIKKWKGNYFQLLKWLQNFFDSHGITEKIPQYHNQDKEK
jgi:hypothetical protein